jgi:hypothetical protein
MYHFIIHINVCLVSGIFELLLSLDQIKILKIKFLFLLGALVIHKKDNYRGTHFIPHNLTNSKKLHLPYYYCFR